MRKRLYAVFMSSADFEVEVYNLPYWKAFLLYFLCQQQFMMVTDGFTYRDEGRIDAFKLLPVARKAGES